MFISLKTITHLDLGILTYTQNQRYSLGKLSSGLEIALQITMRFNRPLSLHWFEAVCAYNRSVTSTPTWSNKYCCSTRDKLAVDI